jgi:mono/diheme cytochrome c family protein
LTFRADGVLNDLRFVNDDGAIPCRSSVIVPLIHHKETSMSRALAIRIGGPALATLLLTLGVGAWAPSGLAQAQTPWVAPESEKAKKNPAPSDKKTVDQGAKVAKINCLSCHGAKGKGDGPAAVALNPKPADWTSKRVQDMSDGELFWKMTTGRGAMPSWRHLPESDRWAIVRYIRTLAGK